MQWVVFGDGDRKQYPFGRHAQFRVLCQDLLACLKQYEQWMDEMVCDTDAWREAKKHCRAMIEDVEGWEFDD